MKWSCRQFDTQSHDYNGHVGNLTHKSMIIFDMDITSVLRNKGINR